MAEQQVIIYRAERIRPDGTTRLLGMARDPGVLAAWVRPGVRIVPEPYTPMVTSGSGDPPC